MTLTRADDDATLASAIDPARICRVDLPASARRMIERAAGGVYPDEACGVLIGDAREGTARIELATEARNLERDRRGDRYELDPRDFVASQRRARALGLGILGFWHSHPDHPAEPSRRDLESAWPGYLYLIVTTTAHGVGPLRCWRLGASESEEIAVRDI